MLCQDCGHKVECPHCTVTLTFHENDQRLICHMCGFQRVPLRKCPECESPTVLLVGFGTERVERVLNAVFKQAKIARIDTDTSQIRPSFSAAMLSEFSGASLDVVRVEFPFRWGGHERMARRPSAPRSKDDNAIRDAFRKVVGFDPFNDGVRK